jgi:3D-(3,5/4)-trihydroxycyclohexane-1,2-dione acylhydrolase (decyclizing)
MAQALIAYLEQQYVERDGRQQPFFAGMFGIFGHGNVAGIGQALHQHPSFRYYQSRNEQAMVHTAAAFAKMSNRLRTFACTTSIGPGATNMVTGAAQATINRLPVLLLPGDILPRDWSLRCSSSSKTHARRMSRSTTASDRSRAIGTGSTVPSS